MAYNNETGLYEGYIYKITNNVNGKVYIGQTIRTISERWKEHKELVRSNRKKYCIHNAMNKYGIDNFKISQLLCVSKKSINELIDILNEYEINYISTYNSLIPNGYNLTEGGENTDIRYKVKIDQYTKDGMIINEFNSISDALEKVLGNRNNSMTSIIRCCEGDQCTAYGYVWRYHGESFNNQRLELYNQKSIDVYTKDGVLIDTFISISECAKKMNIKNRSNISYCCSGKIGNCEGLVFRYHGDDFNKYKISKKHVYSPVNQYSTNGDFIRQYPNPTKAAITINTQNKLLNTVKSSISLCLNHKNKTAFGFKWFYADDPLQPDKSKIIQIIS